MGVTNAQLLIIDLVVAFSPTRRLQKPTMALFIVEELTLEVGHLREELVLRLELQMLLVLVSSCLPTRTPATLAS